MILIFDLDDTLYNEMDFVKSGLTAVAKYGDENFGWCAKHSLNYMLEVLLNEGRGHIFDRWLSDHNMLSKRRITECLNIYRQHKPTIKIYPEASFSLEKYKKTKSLYLVTDGHKIVQKNKIEALQLSSYFKRTFITHRFGIRHAKPSAYCFELIRKAENADWHDIVYVGDNPAKDFVNLNTLGALTVRVKTGCYKDAVARTGFDAQFTITDLTMLPDILT